MAKRDQYSPMDHFSPAHQPDEGYSEEPINPTAHLDLPALLSTLRSPSDLPAWLATNASLLPVKIKTELTMALLAELPTSAIAEIVERLNPRLYIDFIRYLPAEICVKILGYLDPVSLVSVTQTCRAWYDLALDRKLWEKLYYMEGWKAIPSEIEAWEAKINAGLNNSISHLHRIQTSEGRTSKIRALLNDDEDLEMADNDRILGYNDASIVGSPVASPSSNMGRWWASMGAEVDWDKSMSKGKSVDRSFNSSDSRSRRREEDSQMGSLPPILPTDPEAMVRSTLGMWDVNSSRYRINWKYMYNMRRRLESNWELGKYTTFQLPHPQHLYEGHQECVYTIQFDADYLVSGSRDQTMRKWNMHTRRLIGQPLVGHTGSVLCLQFDSDPEEDLLVSGSSDSNVFIWKFSTGEILQKITKAHRESVLNVRFDKRVLVTSSKDKTIKIFNRRPLRYGDVGYTGPHDVVAPAARSLKRYGYEPDLSNELPVIEPWTMIGRLDGHTAAVNAIQVRDETVVSVSGDRHIKIWNWPNQACTKTIPAHEKGIACVEYDGRRIVSGSSDLEVCIFDAQTGLKVAQLRGHAYLVRTVQAGFGDLPYSKFEDELEAKAVDDEYFKAVEAGEVTHENTRTSRHSRRVNPGSSRPEDVQATGAKVPPGGGGGKRYGRIVSGSYDQSIIIWRRDKGGVWKPAHNLRQEEAAASAQRRAAPVPDTPRLAESTPTTLHSAVRPLLQTPATQPGSQQLPGFGHLTFMANMPHLRSQEAQSGGSESANLLMALIDQVVPLGVSPLQQALAQHPAMLVYHNYLQAAIEREPSPFMRTLLRHAVADALVALQTSQADRQRSESGAPPALPTPSIVAGSTSSMQANVSMGSGHSNGSGSVRSTFQSLNTRPDVARQESNPMQSVQTQPQAQLPQQDGAADAGSALRDQAAQHHPHIAIPENAPARVFKLQFDARKIVCCSQAPVIVGWDFCNNDPELEQASRFFATVD
ncbi:hypothetical protein S7711_02703 [Stachybotrys chartarum IBT 7711]|uniref:F-box domain-containing protein n=1 Tax=Stachybotrys chartarum (strain CBS 109288 / IBT 7711) TaxID=1280523 RepID=A0A084AZ16_STACB|nr:hypothetical protein S7711_02703 [Stachybotrys chartarum IBT 7711]KFA54374.1 hypothetical protein S40293_04318 [Stachybotrys chartarum IBT 40293]KFA73196.1 hypothetical protein S40288_07955 [Stachybotrys chartarum IBT 40288]